LRRESFNVALNFRSVKIRETPWRFFSVPSRHPVENYLPFISVF
jgi:hypothetical protein